MDNTIRALRASEKVADAIPVPGLRAAISLALHIIETVEVCDYTYRLIRDCVPHYLSSQHTRVMRERCRELAQRAARLTLAVYEHLRGCAVDGLSPQTSEHVATLIWCA